MTRQSADQGERARQLMMAALDGELSDEDRAELQRFLEREPVLREEWTTMSKVKHAVSSAAYRQPPDEVWDSYWVSVYNRLERGAGWILVSLGAIVLMGFGIFKMLEEMFADPEVPLIVTLAIMALLGFAVLLVSVAREKLFTRRHDPYKEIQR